MFGVSLTASGWLQASKDLIKDPYKYVLRDLQCYVTKYFPNVSELGVLKKNYLPKRFEKRGVLVQG